MGDLTFIRPAVDTDEQVLAFVVAAYKFAGVPDPWVLATRFLTATPEPVVKAVD